MYYLISPLESIIIDKDSIIILDLSTEYRSVSMCMRFNCKRVSNEQIRFSGEQFLYKYFIYSFRSLIAVRVSWFFRLKLLPFEAYAIDILTYDIVRFCNVF